MAAVTSQWNPRLDHAKRGRRRYRLENENVDENICRRAKKSRKSLSSAAVGGCRKQSCGTNSPAL